MSFSEFIERFKRGPADVVGIDIGSAAVKAVRLRRGTAEINALGAEILPPIDRLSDVGSDVPVADGVSLGSKLRARSTSLAFTGRTAVIKLVSFPGAIGPDLIDRLPESMGVQDPEAYRISYQVIAEGHGRAESRVLTVAVPDDEASAVMEMFATGLPAPYSLEISALASLTAFQHGVGKRHQSGAVGVLEFGWGTTTLTLINRGRVVLLRRFEIGSRSLTRRVRENLGVTEETARDIIGDASFDISETVHDLMMPVIGQTVLSRDFVERREDCHIETLYASGALLSSRDVTDGLTSALGIDLQVWDPFEGIVVAQNAIPDELDGQRWQFAGAVGAALGTLEES